jgi:hypothetical protein
MASSVRNVVLLPGLLCKPALFSHQAGWLQRRGVNVIIPPTALSAHDTIRDVAGAVAAELPPEFALAGKLLRMTGCFHALGVAACLHHHTFTLTSNRIRARASVHCLVQGSRTVATWRWSWCRGFRTE